MSKSVILLFISLHIFFISSAVTLQLKSDTTVNPSSILPEITVIGKNSKNDLYQLPEIVGTSIYAGKKNTLILMQNVHGNVVINNMRQILAKVPGIHIWESDPSGIQIGISSRGLSPNRSWEFNVRQNGYDIAADPYGYPEAYYNPPLQCVQRIEIIRGQGSLQYGPQFGGMANYILKNGSDINKPFEFESIQTTGSNQLFSSYNAIGGRTNSMNYYSFFDHRNGNGWRQNSRYFSNAGFGVVSFAINNKASISAEVMISHSRSQQGGGLTESQFEENPKQSFRQRNWLDIVWITPAISYNYNVNNNTKWNTKLFATIGDRNSVGFIQPITIKDSINTSTNNFNNRTLNADKYRNVGIESRVISSYTFLKSKNTIAGGIRLYNGNTYRESNGKGSTGMDYDMTAINPHPNDIAFNSKNIAFFIENIFRINKRLSIIPGCRFEWLEGTASGRNGYTSTGNPIYLQNIKKSRSFIISGIGAEYHVSKDVNVYSNITQAYRPIQFANLQAPPTTDKVDENLADAKGYNFDLGIKGKVKDIFQFDVSLFYLNYKNRIGTITPAGANYRLITNIGSSYSNGIESFFEVNPLKIFKINTSIEALLFTSYSLTIAKYKSDYKDGLIKGNDVENVPRHILRTGVSVIYKSILLSTQFSYTDKVFSDANNTLMPSSNGQTGLIPAYKIWDATIGYKAINKTNFKLGINNLLNKNYFTRRAGGYPGPGVLPGDGRTFFISIATKI